MIDMNSISPSYSDTVPRQEMAYIILRTALNYYKKPPAELDGAELEKVNQLAVKEFEIESKILKTKEARDIVVPESVVDQSLKNIEERYSGKEEFLSDLERNGINMEMLRQSLHRELKVESVMDRVAVRAADISDIDVQIYYYLHLERMQKPEMRSVRHILITINDEFPENARDRALARMEMLFDRVKRKPKRFAEQAMKHSECPTAMQGGYIGKVNKGQLYPELDQILFSMKQGEVSEVVESPIGFHLLLCESIEKAGAIPYSEAKKKIRDKLEERRKKRCQRMWLKTILSEN